MSGTVPSHLHMLSYRARGLPKNKAYDALLQTRAKVSHYTTLHETISSERIDTYVHRGSVDCHRVI